MKRIIQDIKNAGLTFWITVLYGILIILYIVGAIVFQNSFPKNQNTFIIIWVIVGTSSFALLIMIVLLYWKLRKLSIVEIQKYLALKRAHQYAKMGKNAKFNKFQSYFSLVLFYFFTLKPVLSIFSLIIILFSAQRLQNFPLWIVYLILVWNALMIVISLVQISLFSTTYIKVSIQHYQLLSDMASDIYPDRIINRKNFMHYRSFISDYLINQKAQTLASNEKQQAKSATTIFHESAISIFHQEIINTYGNDAKIIYQSKFVSNENIFVCELFVALDNGEKINFGQASGENKKAACLEVAKNALAEHFETSD